MAAAAIEGFRVTLYQANFASHHTRNRHVDFHLAWSSIGKYNKMFLYFLSTLIYPAHFEDVPCQSGVNYIYEG